MPSMRKSREPFVVPDDIQVIFGEPGPTWTDGQERRVIEWLNEPTRHRYFLVLALRVLGDSANHQDAEDAWHDFFTPRDKGSLSRFGRTVRGPASRRGSGPFDPAVGPFLAYLIYRFVVYCREARKKLWWQAEHERSLPWGDDQGDPIDIVIVNPCPDTDPAHEAEQEDLREWRRKAIVGCLNTAVSPGAREVLVRLYFEGQSYKQIKEELGIGLEAVKRRANYGREQLRKGLRGKIGEANL